MDTYDDLTDLPLADAMIRFAVRPYTVLKYKVFQVKGWKIFKSEYECNENALQLHEKFWGDIIPNMRNYDVVKERTFVAESLNRIPNPRKIQSIPSRASANVTEKDAYIMLREESERKTRQRFNDPKLIAFRTHCIDFLKRLAQRDGNRSEQSEQLLVGVDQTTTTTATTSTVTTTTTSTSTTAITTTTSTSTTRANEDNDPESGSRGRERNRHHRPRASLGSRTSNLLGVDLPSINVSPFPSPSNLGNGRNNRGSEDSHDGHQSSNSETRRDRSRSADSRVDSVEAEDP